MIIKRDGSYETRIVVRDSGTITAAGWSVSDDQCVAHPDQGTDVAV